MTKGLEHQDDRGGEIRGIRFGATEGRDVVGMVGYVEDGVRGVGLEGSCGFGCQFWIGGGRWGEVAGGDGPVKRNLGLMFQPAHNILVSALTAPAAFAPCIRVSA